MKKKYTHAAPARIHVKPEVSDGCRPTAIAATITAFLILVGLVSIVAERLQAIL